jgi:NADPH:quinone reductase-like Zn-dependent oxidoreductase
MKAIFCHKYGTPGNLELIEVDKPVHKDDEVLISVYVASLNDWDAELLKGYFINRIIKGFWKPK